MTIPKMTIPNRGLVDELQRNPHSECVLSVFGRRIADGEGRTLFRELTAVLQEQESDDSAAYARLLGLLDRIWEVNPGIAGYLMGRLFPAASKRMLHNVCDGIDLRMYECTSVEVAEALTQLAAEGTYSKRCLEWVRQIRSQSRRAEEP
jgi:hypothetical protein